VRSITGRISGHVLLLAVIILTLLGLVGCTSSIHIEWVNFIKFGGITYIGNPLNQGRAITESDLGPEFAKVKFKVSSNVNDPGYHTQDGDAAYLDPGTPVYTVKGYKFTFRLAAHDSDNNRLVLFEADTNPNAKKGADLLDIAGKVEYIGVNSEQDSKTELAAIKDPKEVGALVNMVLAAPVEQDRPPQNEPQYFIAFHLEDGTTVTRQYGLHTGELSRGILLPKAFEMAVEQALQK
jgi:hypothetical protein